MKGNQPIRLPGLKPGVCSGLILSGAFYPDLKIGVWRRRTYQKIVYPFCMASCQYLITYGQPPKLKGIGISSLTPSNDDFRKNRRWKAYLSIKTRKKVY